MRAAQRLSRPNRVKNHGAPAATNSSSGLSAGARRSSLRSASARSTTGASLRSSLTTVGGSQPAARRGAVTTSVVSSIASTQSRSAVSPGATSTSQLRSTT